MAIAIENIELGAGELTVILFDGDALYWDDPALYWDSGLKWPMEYSVGMAVEAEFSFKRVHKEIEIGQVIPAIKSASITIDGSFKATVPEFTLVNLVVAIGGDPADISSDKFIFKGKRVVYGLKYAVKQLENQYKRDILEIYRAYAESGLSLGFSKVEERKWEVTFKVLAEKAKSYQIGAYEHET